MQDQTRSDRTTEDGFELISVPVTPGQLERYSQGAIYADMTVDQFLRVAAEYMCAQIHSQIDIAREAGETNFDPASLYWPQIH